jgi:hypothetical protein
VEFSSHYHFYKLSHSWLLGRCHHYCLLWLACLFTVHMGSCPSPFSCGVFLTLSLLQAFLLQGCWAGAATPTFSIWLVCLQFHEGFPLIPLGHSEHPALFAVCLFLLLLLLFFPGKKEKGAMLIWPRVVCGSTACRLAHLVVRIFPSGLGAGVWWHGNPLGFSI